MPTSRPARRVVAATVAAATALAGLLVTTAIPAGSATGDGTLLYSGGRVANYSRVVPLADGSLLAAHSVEFSDNDGAIRVYRSTDGGASFAFLTQVRDGTGKQIGTPDLVESSPGVVRLAYNRWNDAAFEDGQDLRIVTSTTGGASWSAPVTLESGVWNWEPEFARSADGRLQLYYSYASTLKSFNMSMFDQVIVRRESADNGATWGPRVTVLGSLNGDNYGMPRIAKAGSTYYMAVEYYDDSGAVVVSTSADGKSWSATTRTMEVPGDGWMFSTPELVAVGSTLYGLGKKYNDAGWGADENNGHVMLRSTDGGRTWTEAGLPFRIGFRDEDSNWSPNLLPRPNGRMFLVTGSHVGGGATMSVRFGTGPVG